MCYHITIEFDDYCGFEKSLEELTGESRTTVLSFIDNAFKHENCQLGLGVSDKYNYIKTLIMFGVCKKNKCTLAIKCKVAHDELTKFIDMFTGFDQSEGITAINNEHKDYTYIGFSMTIVPE